MSDASPEIETGDELARHAGALRRLARGLLYDRARAEDAVQQAWLAALRRQPPAAERRAWLFGAVRRVAASQRREEARRAQRERAAARPEATPAPEAALERLELTETLVGALRALAEPYRSTLVAHYLDGLSLRELARRSGVPLETVRTRRKRGLALLRGTLEERRPGAREEFLRALAPLAGPIPLALQLGAGGAGIGAAAQAAGGIVMGSKAGLAGIAAVAAVVATLAIWRAGGFSAADAPQDSARAAGVALAPEGAAPPVAPAPATSGRAAPAEERTARTAAPAPPAGGQVLRGVVVGPGDPSLAPTPLAGVPLEALLVDAAVDATLARAELESDAAGGFEWALEPPDGPYAVTVRSRDPERYGEVTAQVAAGGAAPQDLELLLLPYDARLSGTVRDAAGAGIPGARVDAGGELATTDAAGRYALGIRRAVYARFVRFTAPGHAQLRQVLELQPGAAQRLDVELRPEFRVVGRVEDAFGNPLEGAEVTSFYTMDNPARTAADGSYTLGCLDPGRPTHSVTARKDGYVLETEEVAVDGREQAELVLVLSRGVRVEGVVLGPDRAPVAGAKLYIGFSPNAYDRLDAECDARGRFVFPAVRRGEQTLVTEADGYAPDSRRIEVPAEGDVLGGLEVVLSKGHFVAGRVLDDEERPVAGARVIGQHHGEYIENSTQTDEAGAFRLEHLPGSDVSLEVYGQDFVRTEQRLDALDRDDVVIRVPRAGGVAGTVVDGQSGAPVESFRIRFVDPRLEPGQQQGYGYSATWSREGHRFATPDGTWSSKGARLRPGQWLGVEASADGYGPSVAAAVEITVEPDPAALVIELFPESFVRGTVVSTKSGQPVAGATVKRFTADHPLRANDSDDVHGRLMAQTDAFGRFELRGVPAGEMSLSVEHEGFAPTADGPFDVPQGADPAPRRVELGAGAVVRGRLLSADGAALADEGVELRARGGNGPPRRVLEATTDAEGRFSFERVDAGTHELVHVLRAGRYQRVDALARVLELRAGEVELEADLRPTGSATLRGGVTCDEELPAGVTVALFPRGDTPRRGAVLDADGRFVLAGVEPGRYWVNVNHMDWETSRRVSGAEELELTAGEDRELWVAAQVSGGR